MEMIKNPKRNEYSQGIKMEKTEVYDIQIFNIIEEIEDIFDAAQAQNNAESSSIEIQTLNSG
jgi:hypothetical protein